MKLFRFFVALTLFLLPVSSHSFKRASSHPFKPILVQARCFEFPSLLISDKKTGCGVPSNVNQDEFGDNLETSGWLRIVPRRKGLRFFLKLKDLPRSDLVITAWIVWELPTVPLPDVFKVAADIASPLGPTTAHYAAGLAKEPNQFTYINKRDAILRISTDFNPTFPNEGPLAYRLGLLQKCVPDIQGTDFRQFPVPGTGTYTPVTSGYIRQYDPETGFEKLGPDGRPLLVRSPIKAKGIFIIAHLDKTTHGISQGNFPVDHYTIVVFPLPKGIGKPIVSG